MSTAPGWLDASLYPDVVPPVALTALGDHVDFLARLCAAWDFGLLPDQETVVEIRRPAWGTAVDACRLLTSPSYHLVRAWHSLPELPYLGRRLAHIQSDPSLEHV